MRAYRQRLERQKLEEAEAAAVVEEAKTQGYRDGFRTGEEKGEIVVRQKAQEVFQRVESLVNELQRTKHDVLANVQENFYELCQAMAEALLKREFSIRPESFVTVMQRAIAEAVEPGKVKVRVHPETYDRLAGLGSAEVTALLVKDAEVEPFDFKVESSLSVVDVSVRKLIGDLLQQADLSIFQDDQAEKAS
jgi:flagellar assembly protein FliH